MRLSLRPLMAWLLIAPSAPLAAASVVALGAAPVQAATPTVVERPVFDRESSAVLIPFHGPMPRFETSSQDSGTRLVTEFSGTRSRNAVPYKLGVFHPLVNRVEMLNLPELDKVRVTIHLALPSRVAVMPDGTGKLRMQIGESAPEAQAQPFTAHLAGGQPGHTPLAPAPMPHMPAPGPSVPPVLTGDRIAMLQPGTPVTASQVIRKALPDAPGPGVTEVQVRKAAPSRTMVSRDPIADAVVVNVGKPGPVSPTAAKLEAYTSATRNEPFPVPAPAQALVFRPVAALDSVLGVMLMTERASNLGSNFSGMGSTLFGLTGHWPVNPNFNLSLGAEGFAYTVNSTQIPGQASRRDEVFMRLQSEFLPIRNSWVLAVGPGYWARFMNATSNALPPTNASLMFGTHFHHGPAVNARVFYPLWGTFAATAEAAAAPYMLGGSPLGGLYGYQGAAGLKWGTRHLGVSGGWRLQGYGAYGVSYSYMRTGPEVSFVWRF